MSHAPEGSALTKRAHRRTGPRSRLGGLGILGCCLATACGASATSGGTGGGGAGIIGHGGIGDRAGTDGTAGAGGAGSGGSGPGGTSGASGGAGGSGANGGSGGTAGRGSGANGGSGDGAGGTAGRGSGGAAGGAGAASGGAGGTGPSVPVYDPPAAPPLSDGPCKSSLAPPSSLCGGRAGCPVLVDGRFAGDATTQSLDMALTSAGGAHLIFAVTSPSTAANCLFTIDKAGASKVTVNPFSTPAGGSGSSGPTVWLASDPGDRPHAFLGGSTFFRHYYQSGTDWTSEMVPIPGQRTEAQVTSTISSKAGALVLVKSHPPDPGYYRSYNLQLFSLAGSGAWQMTQVFDGAGTQELLGPSLLSIDATGAVVASIETRLDLPGGGLGYADYLWRAGSTSTVSTPSATPQGETLRTVGDATSKDSVLTFTDGDGVHLVFPRAGQTPRALLVPGTAKVPLDGCAVSFANGMPMTCQGHGGERCTLKGSSLVFSPPPRRTDDGAIWFAYARHDVDQDVALRDFSSGVSDPLTYCVADLAADRTTLSFFIARAASPDAAAVDLRLKISIVPDGTPSSLSGDVRFDARGNQLVLAYRVGANTAPYHYLVLDAGRL